jgi:hypothetical protein
MQRSGVGGNVFASRTQQLMSGTFFGMIAQREETFRPTLGPYLTGATPTQSM